MMKQQHVFRALMAGTALAAVGSAAVAQDAGAPSGSVQAAGQSATGGDTAGVPVTTASTEAESAADIVVTAQNRSQRVQDVPIAISVISGDTLTKQNVVDFTSVTRLAPALQVTSDTINTRVTIRGVGTLSNNEAQDQSIAVNIDGEYINRPTVLNASIFDMDRVEVLRGPQGTLYGRNSTGGAVNFITRKPGDVFSANGSLSYGNYDTKIAEGGVDVPFGDLGSVRVSGIYSNHDGYNFHPNTPLQLPQYQSRMENRSGDDDTWGIRGSVKLKPATGLRIDASVEHVEQRLTPASQAYVSLNDPANGPGPDCNQNGYVEVGPNTPGVQCVPKNTHFLSGINRSKYNSPDTGVGRFDQDSTAVRGKIAYDFGPATLTYTGGYRDTKTGNNSATLSPDYVFTGYGSSTKTQSHELRLNGVTSGIQWQLGGFFFKEVLDAGGGGGLYLPFLGPQGGYITYFKHPTNTRSYSGFGQVEVPIMDKLTAVGGLRYTHDVRSALWSNFGFLPNTGEVPINSAPANLLSLHQKDHKLTWLAGLNYKIDDASLLYAKVSTGFKAGGFDGTGSVFKPETNTAYEGGVKLSFGDRRQNLFNVAGFYYDYRNLQNDALLNPALGSQTFNAGKATIYGIEAETVIKLTRFDTLTANANYLHTKYDKFVASYNVYDTANPFQTSLLPSDNADLSGNRLPQAPAVILGAGYDHVFDFDNAGAVTASVFTRYKSNYFLDFFNYNDSKQKAYTQTDLTLSYSPRNGRFTVEGYVRNIENKRPVVYSGYIAAGSDDVYNWQFGPPRTYGGRLSFKF